MKKIVVLVVAVFCASCGLEGDSPKQNFIPVPQTLELVADGFKFTEGPAWCGDGYLLFSDITANKIYKWSEDEGSPLCQF